MLFLLSSFFFVEKINILKINPILNILFINSNFQFDNKQNHWNNQFHWIHWAYFVSYNIFDLFYYMNKHHNRNLKYMLNDNHYMCGCKMFQLFLDLNHYPIL
jgi:hypothetical protein